MSIAITGSSGFLGSHVVRALHARGLPLVGVARGPQAGLPGEARRADLADPDALRAAFRGCSVVIANAALVSGKGPWSAYVATNVRGTEHTLRAAAAAGVRSVVLISSVAVYRTRLGVPMREDHPRHDAGSPRPDWSFFSTDWRYSLSKAASEARAETLARELDLRLTILRPGPIYGSRDPKWTARLLRTARRPLALAPGFGVPLVHAGDVARAAVAAAEGAGAGRAFNLAGPPTPLAAILGEIVRQGGGKARLLPLPFPFWVGYDTSAARAALGFEARPLVDGIAEVLADSSGPGAGLATAGPPQ